MAVDKKSIKHTENTVTRLEDFQGFKILPIVMNDAKVRHYLYIRKHESKSAQDKTSDRTLFLLNLPADATDRHIRKLFKGHHITEITYHDFKGHEGQIEQDSNRKLRSLFASGSSAHVVFEKSQDITEVLDMQRVEKKWAKENESEQPLGFERYTLKYELSRPDAKKLQEEVDTFMIKFKEDEYRKERETLEKMNKMDEDGFTVVVRHKKTKTTDGMISVGAVSTDMAEEIKNKPKKKELVDFYRFQMRDRKMSQLTELRKKFEQDKAKIEKLKQSRKFKPY
ncbi:Putative SSU rRNA processing protein [Rhizopus microsporus]|nr:Putative SSU rRNA processing protein [Rhizopus microsporus]